MAMELTLEDKSFKNPDAATIESALSKLDGESNTFAILARDDLNYIQTCGNPKEGYVLEYQEESLDNHYQSVRTDLSNFDVQRAFKAFAEGAVYKTAVEWRKMAASELRSTSSAGAWIVIVVLLAGAAALAYFKFFH